MSTMTAELQEAIEYAQSCDAKIVKPRGILPVPAAVVRENRAATAVQRLAWKDAALARLALVQASSWASSALEMHCESIGHTDAGATQGAFFTGLVFSTDVLRDIATAEDDASAEEIVWTRLPQVIAGATAAAELARFHQERYGAAFKD